MWGGGRERGNKGGNGEFRLEILRVGVVWVGWVGGRGEKKYK